MYNASVSIMVDGKSKEFYEVCPDGDLYLEVEKDSACILVSSQVMTLSSPVFKKMLTSDFVEGMHRHEVPESIASPYRRTEPRRW